MTPALHQARVVADFCASLGVTFDADQIARMADILGKKRPDPTVPPWRAEAKARWRERRLRAARKGRAR